MPLLWNNLFVSQLFCYIIVPYCNCIEVKLESLEGAARQITWTNNFLFLDKLLMSFKIFSFELLVNHLLLPNLQTINSNTVLSEIDIIPDIKKKEEKYNLYIKTVYNLIKIQENLLRQTILPFKIFFGSKYKYNDAKQNRENIIKSFAISLMQLEKYKKQKLCNENNDFKCKIIGLILYINNLNIIVKVTGGCNDYDHTLGCEFGFETSTKKYKFYIEDINKTEYFDIKIKGNDKEYTFSQLMNSNQIFLKIDENIKQSL
ncbi:uncharacterized protein LOC126903205 isoform X2 [Daktulosphaira vitifoliae]|uniref:uncharacterized protein LOC126903205 isoform X2 n=1 Tax=Daktulosphaira vitifoliae TaxID=58002 RepID=UPI0021A9834B|nr:uncharacterized protein LOC126903205 isoform X2 [Daktulosphaira vitifoliae]